MLSNVSWSQSPCCGAFCEVHDHQDCFGVQNSAPSCNTFTIAPANPSSLERLQESSRKYHYILALLLHVLPYGCSPEEILSKMDL